MNRLIWNQQTGEIKPYPRLDGGAIEGLQDPPWKSLTVITEGQPAFDEGTEFLRQTRAIDPVLQTITFGWRIEKKPPDYQKFYDGILASGVYGAVMQSSGKTGDQATAIAVFATSLSETKLRADGGNENREAFQAAIYLLLEKLALPPEGLSELQALLERCNMADVYALTPP